MRLRRIKGENSVSPLMKCYDYISRRKPVVGAKVKDKKRKATEAEDSDDMYEDFGSSPKKKVELY